MMKTGNSQTRRFTVAATVAAIFSFCGPALAIDDGARAYWKGREGTHGVSFQYLHWNLDASGSQQFDPGQFIYPNSKAEANLFLANYAYHFTLPLLKRPASLSAAIAGGSVNVDVDINGFEPGGARRESSSGFTDPNMQLVVNLFGTPPLKSGVDLLNYEPTWTLDAAAMLAFPIGEYDDDKLVNIGLNRWYGRIALPLKYHFGVFHPGHMSSIEVIPSVWLFAENDDFVGQKLENDPLWQVEAHLTHDFTSSFFASFDLLYRAGFQSEIDGVEEGSKLKVGNIGFTLHYQATHNLGIRTGFSANVFGDDDLDSSIIRIQFIYSWNRKSEAGNELMQGH
jgi:hypothetical protein